MWKDVCANTDGACIGADVVARVSVRPYRELPCIVTWWGQASVGAVAGPASSLRMKLVDVLEHSAPGTCLR